MSISSSLKRSITLPQAVALYMGAVIGAGVLILPGVAASTAGPASLFAWAFDGLLGLPLALTFAFLASRFPDAGGVATFTGRAFNSTWGGIVGWFYFFASVTGHIIVPLTGAYYISAAFGWNRAMTFIIAALILVIALLTNLYGLRLSGRVQLLLSASVILILLTAIVAALPHIQARAFTPLFPHGVPAVGQTMVLLFFAFFGWEAIAQLSSEFQNPTRDIVRSTILSVILVTVLYLGASLAVVATGTYGTPRENRISLGQVVATTFGGKAQFIAALIAIIITLGTTNAYAAATSRLGYALGRDGAFPSWMSRLDAHQVPRLALFSIGGFALIGLFITYLLSWEAEQLLVIPNSLGIATYLIGTAAGTRLLAHWQRAIALIAFILCLAIVPFAGASILLPLLLAAVALLYQRRRRKLSN